MKVLPYRNSRILKFESKDDFYRVLRFLNYLNDVKCPYSGEILDVDENKLQIRVSGEGKRYLRDDEVLIAQLKLSVYGVYIKNPNKKDFEFDGEDILIRSYDKLRLIRSLKVSRKAMEILFKNNK